MLAAFTGAAALALDESESAKLAKAIADVGDHYGLAAAFDPKTVAWINLGQTVVAIYGTRLMTMRMQAKMARDEAAKRAAEQPQVIPQKSTNARTPAPATASIPGLGNVEVPAQVN